MQARWPLKCPTCGVVNAPGARKCEKCKYLFFEPRWSPVEKIAIAWLALAAAALMIAAVWFFT